MRRQESGQAQILIALAMSTVMISAAYYTLERTQKAGETAIRQMKLSEARAALDGAIQFAAYLYQFQSGCDPVLLNEKLSRLNLDGTLLESGTSSPTIRQMDISMDASGNFTAFRVAFGPVTRIAWVGSAVDPSIPNEVGTSQDALIEIWTTSQSTRFIQRAVLINNCTYPCSTSLSSSGYCVAASDAAIAYHQIDPDSFPGSGSSLPACLTSGVGTYYYGMVDTLDQVINVPDLIVLRNYLRSGQTEGSIGTTAETLLKGCADVNKDGMLNEIDLNLIEKLLRGYINYIPVYEPD